MQSVSCYERLRLQNIERNQLFLKNLGLESITSVIPERKQSKTKRKIETIDDSFDARRSHRIANIPAVTSYRELYDVPSSTVPNTGEDVIKKITNRATNSKIQKEPPSDSSRMIDANLDCFFGGTDQDCGKHSSASSINKSTLGETIDAYGKAAVMAAANNGVQPRFSKYSGVCEWKNCVFLWVNIMKVACKGGYNNTFNEKGRFMTWFGGSKMSEDSPVVQRLLSMPSYETLRKLSNEGNPLIKAEEGDDEVIEDDISNDRIVLFVRIEGENYACLGRVAHISHNLQTQPVEFEWELLDFEEIKNKPDFKRMMET